MTHKVLLTWNSHPRHEKELFHHVRELVNKASPLGLELRDAWYTIYGNAPEILLGFTPRKAEEVSLEAILASDEWKQLILEIKDYITDYEQRIVQAADHFQF
ncbi:MAG TPA: hypothetical protein VM366_16310 [Anaerolineae bacterium]|nr:hypothetical protein [Anaerolineae bacterium]